MKEKTSTLALKSREKKNRRIRTKEQAALVTSTCREYFKKLAHNQKEMDAEIAKIINDNRGDLI